MGEDKEVIAGQGEETNRPRMYEWYSRIVKGENQMKAAMKLGFVALMVAALALIFSSSTKAFHDAASLICNKCHTMHYSEGGGAPSMPDGDTSGLTASGPNKHLLYYASVTDLCLVCHRGATGTTIDSETAWSVFEANTDTPGGDFDSSDATEANGHNPSLTGTGVTSALLSQDGTLTSDPPGDSGGALARWDCVSCHSAHGGSDCFAYRNLSLTVNSVDVSGTIGSTNTQEADLSSAYSTTNHNVYWNGSDTAGDSTTRFGAWCGACHGDFHGDDDDTGNTVDADGDWIRHPSAYALGTTIAGNYTTTYDPGIPLVSPQADSWTTGTVTVSNDEEVFCLTCHQAHATGFANAVRWDSSAASGNGNCNKCHNKGN